YSASIAAIQRLDGAGAACRPRSPGLRKRKKGGCAAKESGNELPHSKAASLSPEKAGDIQF
ncbi:MAG TPA: hypothetical protein VFI31_29430, partial [Pirellulales bacterium]|nr:hypothetical protein [Pirellulales bacterium]